MKPTKKQENDAAELAAITHDGWRPWRIAYALADEYERGIRYGVYGVLKNIPGADNMDMTELAERVIALLVGDK